MATTHSGDRRRALDSGRSRPHPIFQADSEQPYLGRRRRKARARHRSAGRGPAISHRHASVRAPRRRGELAGRSGAVSDRRPPGLSEPGRQVPADFTLRPHQGATEAYTVPDQGVGRGSAGSCAEAVFAAGLRLRPRYCTTQRANQSFSLLGDAFQNCFLISRSRSSSRTSARPAGARCVGISCRAPQQTRP